MPHELCRGRVTGHSTADGVVSAAVFSSADPELGVRPGEELHLTLSVSCDEHVHLGFGYLLANSLDGVATVAGLQDVEYFPQQGWYRVRAERQQTATGSVTVRIDDRPKTPRLRPVLAATLRLPTTGERIRVKRLTHAALPIRAADVRGLHLTTDIGAPVSAHPWDSRPNAGSVLSVTQPAHGTVEHSGDDWIHYRPTPGFTGYDRFTYTAVDADGTTATAPVNVFVGELGPTPGVFPVEPPAPAFAPWQWPELTGSLPWPGIPTKASHG
ncbi:Ig-like domain-containing protein [Streptomyces sp. NPDC102384]|uniref:Ig-like domain-containing protein n=1 Tax=Streptomyces sp. NPDC102384 TaxID=3366166 RepID=UPI00381ADFF2